MLIATRRLAPWPLALGLSLASARAEVLQIGGPTPDYPTIQAGVDAAVDGDTLLIRPGFQDGDVVIDDKALTLVSGTLVGPVALDLSLDVRNLAAGKVVALERLAIQGSSAQALAVRFCAGSVRVDDCTLEGAWGLPGPIAGLGPPGAEGVYVTQSADVAFSTCTIQGGHGAYGDHSCGTDPSFGGNGMFVRASNVALYDCSITGGDGGSSDDHDGFAGAIGLRNADAFVYLSGSTVTGGGGGAGHDEKGLSFFPGCGGNGGTGLVLTAAAELAALDSPFVGGSGGPSGFSSYGIECDGAQGFPTSEATGSILDLLPGAARSFTASSPTNELDPTRLRFVGQPGDLAYAYLSTGSAFAYPMPLFVGPRLFAVPTIRRFLVGTIPASGVLDATLLAPPLLPGEENRTWYLQGIVVGSGGAFACNAEPWILLDASF